MGYIATDLARVPSSGFEWYVFLLEDRWNDDLRRELVENFQILAAEVGPSALVVRGSQPEQFYDQVFAHYALHERGFEARRFPLPALLITDTPPSEIEGHPDKLENAKMVLLPLESNYIRPGSITAILREVANTLRDSDSIKALQSLDKSRIEKRWGWITRYFNFKPSFLGFEVDVDQILNDLFLNRKTS